MGRVCFAKEKRQSVHSGAVAVQRVQGLHAILTGHALRGGWPLAAKWGASKGCWHMGCRRLANRFINIY
jgi:hypothetical protein